MTEPTGGSFLDGFGGHWRRDSKDVDVAIKSYALVLDANVLLDLYRMDSAARGEFLAVLEAAKERIWIPHHVAVEFHKNRVSALSGYIKRSKSMVEEVSTMSKGITELSRKLANSRSMQADRKKEVSRQGR